MTTCWNGSRQCATTCLVYVSYDVNVDLIKLIMLCLSLCVWVVDKLSSVSDFRRWVKTLTTHTQITYALRISKQKDANYTTKLEMLMKSDKSSTIIRLYFESNYLAIRVLRLKTLTSFHCTKTETSRTTEQIDISSVKHMHAACHLYIFENLLSEVHVT